MQCWRPRGSMPLALVSWATKHGFAYMDYLPRRRIAFRGRCRTLFLAKALATPSAAHCDVDTKSVTHAPTHTHGLRIPRGTWCSGITSASHAEGPGFNPQCVHYAATQSLRFHSRPPSWAEPPAAQHTLVILRTPKRPPQTEFTMSRRPPSSVGRAQGS